MDLNRLLVEAEIREVLYRYCRGVDRCDRDLVASVYHPGAIDRHGAFEGPGELFAGLITTQDPSIDGSGTHHITNVVIELDGKTANVESFFLAFHPATNDGVEELPIASGRYTSTASSFATVSGGLPIGRSSSTSADATSMATSGRRGPGNRAASSAVAAARMTIHSYEAFSPTFALRREISGDRGGASVSAR